MSSIADKFPKDTFKSLLKINSDDLGSSLSTVESGDGIETPFKLSATAVAIGSVSYPTTGAAAGRVLQVDSGGTTASWIAPAPPVTDYNDLTNKPEFADVAFSGDYADLINAPAEITGGGQLQSGSVTLTATSPMVQKITPTGYNQWVKLPDATTMSAGGVWFMIHNAGSVDIMIKNHLGTLLGFIRPNVSASVGLVSASTPAGDWVLTGTKELGLQVSTELELPSTLGAAGRLDAVVALDANREMLFFQGTASIWAVVWDSTTNEYGPPFNVRTATFFGGSSAMHIKVTTDRVLVVSVNTSLLIQGVVLSVTGSTITGNTVASVSGTGSTNYMLDLIAVEGQGFALAYSINGSTVGIRAVTVTGTTVAIGAENTQSSSAASANNPPSLYDAGSGRILAISWAPSVGYIRPITMSGTTLTTGTQASMNITDPTYSVRLLESGRWAIIYKNSSGVYGALITLTGTVASITTGVPLLAGNSATMPVVWAKGNQIVVCGDLAGSPFMANVFTDNNGTPVAGTMLSREGNPYTAMIGYDANSVHVLNTGGTSADGRYLRIGIQGNNAVIQAAASISSVGYDTGGYPVVPNNGNSIINTVYGKNQIHPLVLQGSRISIVNTNHYALNWKCSGGMVELETRMPSRDWNRFPSKCRVGNSALWLSNTDGSTAMHLQRIQVA